MVRANRKLEIIAIKAFFAALEVIDQNEDQPSSQRLVEKMQEFHQGARSAQYIVFEPKWLELHVTFGDDNKPATQFPLKEIDLSKMLRP
jgi:hypothetical protein